MFKLIKKIGFLAYLVYLWRLNLTHFRKIVLFLFFIFFCFFFYPDVINLLKNLNLNYFIHALVFKWFLIFIFSFLIYRQILYIDWEISFKKIQKLIIEVKDKNLQIKLDLKRIGQIKEIEEDLSKYKDINKYPKLKSEMSDILENDT